MKAFTLLELLVVIAIIGIIASVATSKYNDYKLRAKVAAAAQELANLRGAFYAYLVDNETLPTDTTAGVVPSGMEDFIPSSIFSNDTPVGGSYNWDGLPNHAEPGISIQDPTIPSSYMNTLDQLLDDGDLNTGQFQETNDGHYKLIIEP